MTKTVKVSIVTFALTLVLTTSPSPVMAEEQNAECIAAVGTFLTRNRFTDQQGGEHMTRSLISLTKGGQAFRDDSNQDAAENGFSVGEGRGAWRCHGVEGGTVKLTARMLNFIYPKAGQDQALIGRMDYAGTYDTEDNVLRLTAKLGFLPLEGDPLLGDIPADAINVDIVGLKVESP